MHQISIRTLIAHNIVMLFNMLDYYKGTMIYQHCFQLIHKKDIPCNLLFPHSVEFSKFCLALRGRFDFQWSFAMWDFD